MTFCEALAEMKSGARVRRPEWKTGVYLYMREGRIYNYVSNEGKGFYFGQFAQKLITADDWEVVGYETAIHSQRVEEERNTGS